MVQSKTLKNKLKTSVMAASLGVALIGFPAGAVVATDNHKDSDRAYSQHRDGGRDSQRGWWGQKWWWHNDDDTDAATCDERQETVDQAIANFKERSETKHANLALYLENQQTFVGDNSMEIENYESLSAKADTANIAAGDAIENLEAPTVDCERSERHDDRMLKEAKQPVREALKRFSHKVTVLSWSIINNS